MGNTPTENVTYIRNADGVIIAEIVGDINIDYLTRSIYDIKQSTANNETSIR